jgi:hypothetical protein
MEQAAASNNLSSMCHLTNALRYLAAISGGQQSSLQVIGAAENQVQYWLEKVIDERIEAATGARP